MKTTPLPIQLVSASPSPAPQRANAAAGADARQFSQTLSREMEQRQQTAAPTPTPSPTPAPTPTAPSASSTQAPAKPAKPDKAAGDADKDDAADAANGADTAAVSPVTDMLALVASFNQPAVAATATDPLAASVAAQASGVAGKHVAGKVQADDKEPGLKEIKQMLDGAAARFAVKGSGGAVAPEAKAKDAAEPVAGSARRAGAGTAPLADAAQKPDADSTAPTTAKTEPAPVLARAEEAPLRARETVADVAALKEQAVAAPVSAPVQQASLAMAQAVTGAPTDRIAARVGTPGWDGQLGQKIVWMVAGKEQSASLTLNPPDMGPMQVVLSVTNDQATVTFSAAQPEVRQALEDAMPKLREMMGESGIALGNATVNSGTPDQRQAQQGEQPRSQAGGARFGANGGDGQPNSLAPARPERLGGGNGLVDTFA